MKRILIDANPVVPIIGEGRHTGIGRTCLELIRALDSMREELPFEIALYTQNLHGVSGRRLNTGFRTRHAYMRNIPAFNHLARALRVREILAPYDLQHITHNCEIVTDPSRCIATVHDAFFMKLDVGNFDYAAMRRQYPPFIRACRHIITCSDYSKHDIMETIGVPDEKITVIPWGVDHTLFHPEPDRERLRQKLAEEFSLTRPYFLSVSCDAGRKRTPDLIKAWLSLTDPAHDLVLVWGNPPAEVRRLIDGHPRIHLLSGVSNEGLRHLYNGATAAINPTAYEGFGLPVLEAMACGCPSITCRNSSLPEVGGDVAIYIDEPVSHTLPQLLHAIDRGELDLTSARQLGPRQAARFTWQRTARETVAVYKSQLGIS